MLLVGDREAATSSNRMLMIGCLVLGLAAPLSEQAVAPAQDYWFELAAPPAKSAKAMVVKIRLIHAPDGKPVAGAIIAQSKFDMGPEGMATMTTPAGSPASEPGIYQFEVEPSMPGNWAIGLSAKVQGEAETVRGSLTIAVPK